jgi:hypothetical protein
MARSRMLVAILMLAFTGVAVSLRAAPKAEIWIARVSDQACAAQHSGPGHADCIRKCTRGGAAIGHAEWKPQPLVLVKEHDQSVWTVDNPSSLSGLEGQRVRAEVKVDPARKGVYINRVRKTSERNP